jgi:OFA family oxalate/formate antiporter-like MFS transporter
MKKSFLKPDINNWVVLWTSVGVNLVAGILYVWSIINKGLVTELGWTSTQASLPYTIASLSFVLSMIFFGKIMDVRGPRICVVASGILAGIGLILSGIFIRVPWLVALLFGVVTGAGLGSANVATTSTPMKWFHESKKGLVTGVSIAAVGLSPVIYSPISNILLNKVGISNTFVVLGIAAFILMLFFSRTMDDPAKDYVPEGTAKVKIKKVIDEKTKAPEQQVNNELSTREMLKTSSFYAMWIMLAFSSSAGVMVIAHAANIAKVQVDWDGGFLLVILLAIFNALGRFLGGGTSDKIGRINTMRLVFFLQAVNMLCLSFYNSVGTLAVGIAIAGLCYGAGLTVFPPTISDFYGSKNFGSNFGVVWTSWGVSGLIGPMTAARILDTTGSYKLSYIVSAVLLILALIVSFVCTRKKKTA